ncbi:cysteine synthase 2 [Micractinium conductrix]|uniref:cysteine synthase n=1 Tax=Micractinium conductrix TaxID=554055 RepID=A0A2P6VN41_9CHLO|nr:cysteine synthase 2 [Micractinium conductrix]|eukprot:PSC75522.1 cysteine synthase 2 [Micractinium conductrix]
MVGDGATQRVLLLAAGGGAAVLAYRLLIAGQSRPSAPSLALQHLTDLLALLYRAVSGGSGGGASDGGASSLLRVGEGLVDLIGNTPLIRIRSLSEETGCEILAKAEFLNPGGSVKDRVALQVIQEAVAEGRLRPGGLVTEGTVGSTGVSLAMCAAAFGCRAFIAMPDDAAIEKAQMLEALGAEVQRLRPVSITHPDHFVNVARRRAAAAEDGNSLFADQFETPANFRAHLKTGEEILRQTGGRLHAFVSGAGTGGTIAGVSAALKQRRPEVQVFLVDPPGSSLYNKVTRGVMYTREEAEGKRLRHPFDTITEGIGINRLTANFSRAKVDGAFKGSDREAVEMAQYLLRNEGLFVGSSAAMNCVGAVKVARALGSGHTIVTVLCDGGHRHLSKFHSPAYLAESGLTPEAAGRGLGFVE